MRLAEIEVQLGEQVSVEWRSFLLRPTPEPRPADKFAKYTKSWQNPASMEPKATFVEWSGEHAPPSHSFPSAVAGKVAGRMGVQAHRAFSNRCFEAYFTENRTISDRDVLVSIAAEAGLDADRFSAIWHELEDELVSDVWADYTTAQQSGITGVPAVVVNRRFLVPGAVDTEQYLEVIEKAREQPFGTADLDR